MLEERIVDTLPSIGIEIITTGGTFDTLADGCIGPPQASTLLEQARVTLPITCRELMRLDSSLMQDVHRSSIRAAVMSSSAHRIVIVHGTDTLLLTAAAVAGIPGKVMVLTGSFTPAGQPGDAAFNLGAAVLAAQLLPPGVHVVMGGECFHPAAIRKDPVARRFERI